jgi:hypothetical protein
MMLKHLPPRSVASAAFVAVGAVLCLGTLASLSGCTRNRVGMPKDGYPATLEGLHVSGAAATPVIHSPLFHSRNHGAAHSEILARAGVSAEPRSAETPLDQLLAEGDRPLPKNGLCPPDMASIDDLYCIDRYEGTLLELTSSGEKPFPSTSTVDGHTVRAVSELGVMPQAYISGKQAQEACMRSGKRLCKASEWRKACRGPENKRYGYAEKDEPKRCNDHGRAPLAVVHNIGGSAEFASQYNWQKMNDPALNQVPGTVAKTGEHDGCTNGYGVYDMVGNVHEWIDDPAGTFLGGYYLDTHINGEGCGYTSDAHAFWYHDYSTGFRCCADVAP